MPTEGTCPVCERAARVRAEKIVHHGFQRPGRGHIVGDCFGVGAPPYEVSPAGTRTYLGQIIHPRLRTTEAFLGRLEAGEVEALHYEARVPVPWAGPLLGRSDRGWTHWPMQVRADEIDVQRQHLWRRVYAAHVTEAQGAIGWLKGEVERCERLIRGWAPRELRDVPRALPSPGAPMRRRRRRLFLSRST
jgi:hypothetical protein